MSNEATVSAQGKSECRALVVLNPTRSCPAERPQAAFLMQLIACERRLAAYRTARQASSTEAASLYAGRPQAAACSLQRVI